MQVLVGVQHAPQKRHGARQAFVRAMLHAPDLIDQFLPRDDLTRPRGQNAEHLHDLRLKPVALGAIGNTILVRFDQQGAKAEV